MLTQLRRSSQCVVGHVAECLVAGHRQARWRTHLVRVFKDNAVSTVSLPLDF
jgi:hypothetical protein